MYQRRQPLERPEKGEGLGEGKVNRLFRREEEANRRKMNKKKEQAPQNLKAGVLLKFGGRKRSTKSIKKKTKLRRDEKRKGRPAQTLKLSLLEW